MFSLEICVICGISSPTNFLPSRKNLFLGKQEELVKAVVHFPLAINH